MLVTTQATPPTAQSGGAPLFYEKMARLWPAGPRPTAETRGRKPAAPSRMGGKGGQSTANHAFPTHSTAQICASATHTPALPPLGVMVSADTPAVTQKTAHIDRRHTPVDSQRCICTPLTP